MPPKAKKPEYRLTTEGRKRISDAQKKRWRQYRRNKKAAGK